VRNDYREPQFSDRAVDLEIASPLAGLIERIVVGQLTALNRRGAARSALDFRDHFIDGEHLRKQESQRRAGHLLQFRKIP
jgi:hypothetical protein